MKDETSPPVDLRYLCKPRALEKNHEIRADVVSFLNNLYTSVAETLPDVRDDPLSPEEDLSLQKPGEEADPYAQKLADVVAGNKDLGRAETKKRTKRKGVEINPQRINMEKKWLPPGNMRDHWEQYWLVSTLSKPASFPTFWRDSWILEMAFCEYM